MTNLTFENVKQEVSSFLETPEGKKLLKVLPAAGITLILRARSSRARKNGDWLAAIYWLLLWAGYSNNFTNGLILEELEKQNKANPFINK